MGFHRLTYNWATCDYCEYETEKDSTTRDIYLRNYLAHLKSNHPSMRKPIYDLEALLSPFDPYKVKL